MEERTAYEEEAGKEEDPENASEDHVTSQGGVEGLQLSLGWAMVPKTQPAPRASARV